MQTCNNEMGEYLKNIPKFIDAYWKTRYFERVIERESKQRQFGRPRNIVLIEIALIGWATPHTKQINGFSVKQHNTNKRSY